MPESVDTCPLHTVSNSFLRGAEGIVPGFIFKSVCNQIAKRIEEYFSTDIVETRWQSL